MDKDDLVDYIKWLISELDKTDGEYIDKKEARIMLLAIIGKMYTR